MLSIFTLSCIKKINIIYNDLGDAYEPDDYFYEARLIQTNTVYSHTIFPIYDDDWMKFYGESGITYTIETTVYNNFDTYIRLYNSFGSFIDSDDDSGVGLASRIIYTPGTSNYYYIEVDSDYYYNTGNYDIEVKTP